MMNIRPLIALGLLGATALIAAHQKPPSPQSPARKVPPAEAPADSCVQCHGPLLKQASSHAVAEDCSICHEQQGKAHRFKPAAEGLELCGRCHDMAEGRKYLHGPAAVGECVGCHDPHGAPQPHLLTRAGPVLCESCHVDMTVLRRRLKYTHDPVKKDCAACHDPHGSNVKYQLKAEGAALCALCHKKPALDDKSPVKHAALEEGRQCLNCHEAHAADVQPQLRGATMPLCLGCHDRTVTLPNGDTLINIKEWLALHPDAHGPIRDQDCVACHRPHESDHMRLLRMDYPPKFYSPFDPKNYELCFTCHEPDLVRVERSTTITGFRNGDRNLHFLHVNQPEKGRTCRACHEVHSSRKPKHIRDRVPFGTWSLPINYEPRPDGGYCAPGCHAAQQYERSRATINAPRS